MTVDSIPTVHLPPFIINLIHYDSDKTYYARNKALKILSPKLNSGTIIIFDDIQDNLHFKDLVEKTREDFSVLECRCLTVTT